MLELVLCCMEHHAAHPYQLSQYIPYGLHLQLTLAFIWIGVFVPTLECIFRLCFCLQCCLVCHDQILGQRKILFASIERERVGFGVPSLLTLFSEVYAAHGHRHKANHTNLVSVMIYTSISPKLAILDFTHNRVFSGMLLVSWSVSQI